MRVLSSDLLSLVPILLMILSKLVYMTNYKQQIRTTKFDLLYLTNSELLQLTIAFTVIIKISCKSLGKNLSLLTRKR